jgi:hypothetical protein
LHSTPPTAAESPLPDCETSADPCAGAGTESDADRVEAIAPFQAEAAAGEHMAISGSPLVEDATLSRSDSAVLTDDQPATRAWKNTATTPAISAPPGRRPPARHGSLGSNPTPVMETSPPRSTRRLTLGSRKSACDTPASNVSSEKTPSFQSPPRYVRAA